MLGQRRHVVPPFPERRDHQRDDLDPIIEVLTESPLFDRPFQVLVRRCDDPDVNLRRALGSDLHHFAFLEGPQEFDLQSQGHLADLVQENGPPVGAL